MADHSPSEHGHEFWSSGCQNPVCVRERKRLRPPVWQDYQTGVNYVMIEQGIARDQDERLTSARAALMRIEQVVTDPQKTMKAKLSDVWRLTTEALAEQGGSR